MTVVWERTNVRVREDNAEWEGSPTPTLVFTTEFHVGTQVVGPPALRELRVVSAAPGTSSGSAAETAFDASKTYKITIEEL